MTKQFSGKINTQIVRWDSIKRKSTQQNSRAKTSRMFETIIKKQPQDDD